MTREDLSKHDFETENLVTVCGDVRDATARLAGQRTAHSKGTQMGKERPGQGLPLLLAHKLGGSRMSLFFWHTMFSQGQGRLESTGPQSARDLHAGNPRNLRWYLGLFIRRIAFAIWSCTYVVEEFCTLAAPLGNWAASFWVIRRSKMDQSSFVYLS
ncbi:hypothetical protein FVEG_02504 [Fusarium verticillioides 7600]|uniref:Uncharacterized protein n=1 Tax=Gibberella moniliformis (strain M3125 / FGSC 7600) TaxID=334819 RepID=W7LWK4_GIBM7|nr:hypothetical protein FVEG_02504 [Fusarium verticillioides 7600]EWG39809.1 hypothetical protein FVEG_02504 [Fusarium verticillioides 7600]